MKILLFAQLGEVIAPEVTVELPENLTRQNVLSALAAAFPLQAALIKSSNVAVNQTYLTDVPVSRESANEIAIIPPVSGG